MTSIRVRNWDKWQSYRSDRGTPPWIKVHRNLMTNPDWAYLTDAEKGQLVSIWIVAADKNGQIPADAGVVRKICQLDEAPNLIKFRELGFLDGDVTQTGSQNDAKLTPERRQVDSPETETNTETKTDKISRSSAEAPDRFPDFWSVYPKKVKKAEARKKWKAKKLDAKAEQIITDVRDRQALDRRWLDGFIPDPTTYINGQRWEDEIDTSKPNEPARTLSAVERVRRKCEEAERREREDAGAIEAEFRRA